MYILTSDLTVSCNCAAITIGPGVTTGTIVIDLKGHTVSGGQIGTFFSFVSNDTFSNNLLVTLKNGTIRLFGEGVDFENLGARKATIEISKVTFSVMNDCINFFHVNNAKVTNCSFGSAFTAIRDIDSSATTGGNLYANLSFGGGIAGNVANYISIGSDEADPLSFDRLKFNTLSDTTP